MIGIQRLRWMSSAPRLAATLSVALLLGPLHGCTATAPRTGENAKEPASTVVKCKTAIVSPVSGNAECIDPPGAAVEPPPPRPLPDKDACERHKDLHMDGCPATTPDGATPDPTAK